MTDSQEKFLTDGLELIGLIRPGTTISTSTGKIVNHETWSGSFSRLWNRDDRRKTMEYVEKIVTTLQSVIDKTPYSINMYRLKIQRAILGLENLTKTYKDDENICNGITKIICALNQLITVKTSRPKILIKDDYGETSSETSMSPVISPETSNDFLLNVHPTL
jgi:hypothetical protein